MRIVAVSHACIRAINRAVYRDLRRKGLEIHLVVPTGMTIDGTWVESEPARADDPTVHRLALAGESPRTYRFAGLSQLLDRLRPDVVYLDNDPVSRIAVEAGRWRRRRGKRLVCLSCENLPFDLRSSIIRQGMLRGTLAAVAKAAMVKLSRRNIDHVFTINDDGTRLFRELGFGSVAKTPLGFDPVVFRPDPGARAELRARLGWNGPLVAYFGRLSPEKGVDILVRALARVSDMDWRLLLDRFTPLTKGYAAEVRALLERLGLAPRVLYVDAAHEEMGRYMNAADVVVLPSITTPNWKEQYGRVAPEAMACGTLVLAARCGALPELVGDGGILFAERDDSELARILRDVLARPEGYAEVRARGLKRAQAHLSAAVQVENLMRVFRILAPHPA